MDANANGIRNPYKLRTLCELFKRKIIKIKIINIMRRFKMKKMKNEILERIIDFYFIKKIKKI